MTYTESYQIDPKGILQDEDNSDCSKKVESSKKARG